MFKSEAELELGIGHLISTDECPLFLSKGYRFGLYLGTHEEHVFYFQDGGGKSNFWLGANLSTRLKLTRRLSLTDFYSARDLALFGSTLYSSGLEARTALLLLIVKVLHA